MRKLVVLEFLSLDGVMQAPGGKGEDPSGGFDLEGWIVPFGDDTVGAEMRKQMSPPFDLLLGRKTFEIFASYWPQHADDWPGINDATKYVVSSTLTEHDWNNSVFINGDAVEEIKKLKAQDGPPLQVYGSSNLMQTLLATDLVDELWLKIYPVMLGKGKRLFGGGTRPASLKVTQSTVSPSGVIIAYYTRDGEVKTGSFF
jgi:dihydrofolate reductase